MPESSDNAGLELAACSPVPLDPAGFNENALIPFGCKPEHIRKAMEDFQDWLGLVNGLMYQRKLPRLETMLMPANFSSIVGEFAVSSIPKYCPTVVKNAYHNGHPDIIPAGRFENNRCQHGHEGIEVKGSRYLKSWQGHNPEDTWLMVFVFESSRPSDQTKGIAPTPFRFQLVLGAELKESDWLFAGRSATSRRTITASVTDTGFRKMMANWIYKAPVLDERQIPLITKDANER
jgi:hypothetical protein